MCIITFCIADRQQYHEKRSSAAFTVEHFIRITKGFLHLTTVTNSSHLDFGPGSDSWYRYFHFARLDLNQCS